jgi:hypothetical protein
VAVVVTLGYLATQVRQANRIAKAEAFRAVQDRFGALSASWARDPEWLDLWTRIYVERVRREDLTRAERGIALMQYQNMLSALAAIHHDVELAILPPEAYDTMPRRIFETPYMCDIWPWLRDDHPDFFVRFFESRFTLEPSDSVARIPLGSEGPRTPGNEVTDEGDVAV